jgi:hypothetical protein
LPDEAGISEDVLFFPEAEKSPEGVCHGVFLYQLWLRLITHHTLWITSRNSLCNQPVNGFFQPGQGGNKTGGGRGPHGHNGIAGFYGAAPLAAELNLRDGAYRVFGAVPACAQVNTARPLFLRQSGR